MKPISYFLLLALAGLARADANPASLDGSSPVVPTSPVSVEKPQAAPAGVSSIPDVTRYRCIQSRLYSDNCLHALGRHATREKRQKDETSAECIVMDDGGRTARLRCAR